MTWTILNANADSIPLTDKSVQCVVTSPPYWGLRDYGTATWVGGDEGCDHKPPASRKGDYPDSDRKQQTNSGSFGYREWQDCGKCGATRIDSQIGLEKTPEEYVEKIVAVFREVWRVLRDDGTCWVNLGDTYCANVGAGFQPNGGRQRGTLGTKNPFTHPTKPKDLVGIPWRVAFALQAAGWYLRSDIIWSKPNPMPESVTDRPTKAHEYIFLLSKKERYFFDQDAVREAIKPGCDGTIRARARTANGALGGANQHNIEERIYDEIKGANIRTVWEIATQAFPNAHFATFPEELAERCIKAGSKVDSVVLDPFSGAGTVPLVADKLNRRGIGLELKADYCRMAERRCYDDAPLLAAMEG